MTTTRIAKLKDIVPGSLWKLKGKESYSELVWSEEFKEKYWGYLECWAKDGMLPVYLAKGHLLPNEVFMVIKLFKEQRAIQVLTPRTTGYIWLANARKHMVKIEPKDAGVTES